ncbi:hypothetical protein GUITHDRAFT_103471 [Guillardia theta CCMP2712]|uniref:Uncharacterized protein n=1 Tax=Guillardia theta (strain CCMP2712) TaxID=905079 RepID=L1JQP9_GUITC|nr:hypothetical protein GUITHDRAFT_103471 [Guillardia theta CCMP2712]EKX50886.1 hypothetical protein GUITHDRAFT_103471 [Guillardia theta CCMP2712]|eukprot:XP_005837866.1 hypothetical protein GUITHDRAFT_103471 [Guillardia theta CCMP2712]
MAVSVRSHLGPMVVRMATCLLAMQSSCVGFLPGMTMSRKESMGCCRMCRPVIMQEAREGTDRQKKHVFLIGARDAGKRCLGELVAPRLHASYRELRSVEMLRNFMNKFDECERSEVLACTCPEWEKPECTRLLEGLQEEGHLVIHINRDAQHEDKRSSLRSSAGRAVRWDKIPYRFTNMDYDWSTTDRSMASIARERAAQDLHFLIVRLVHFPACPIPLGSFTVPLEKLPMQSEEGLWREIAAVESGGDALVFRVDLLDETEAAAIERSFAKIRRLSRLPIIWTVRSIAQGGNFRGSEEEYTELMMLGVETSFSFEVQEKIMKSKRHTRIISSTIDPDERFYTAGEIYMTLKLAANAFEGLVDVIRLTVTSSSADQVVEVQEGLRSFRATERTCASVVCNGDGTSELSRLYNSVFTPTRQAHGGAEGSEGATGGGGGAGGGDHGESRPLTASSLFSRRVQQRLIAPRTFCIIPEGERSERLRAMVRRAFTEAGLDGVFRVEDGAKNVSSFEQMLRLPSQGMGGWTSEDVTWKKASDHVSALTPACVKGEHANFFTVLMSSGGELYLHADEYKSQSVGRILRGMFDEEVIDQRRSSSQPLKVLLLGEEKEVRAAAAALILMPLGFVSAPISFLSPSGSPQQLPCVESIDLCDVACSAFDLVICSQGKLEGEEIRSAVEHAEHVIDLDSDEMLKEESISVLMVREGLLVDDDGD